MAGNDHQKNLEEIFASYIERLNGGEELDPEKILAENPVLGAEIIEYLEGFVGFPSSQADPNEPLGTLGDYTLRHQLGRGGMGIVYEAWQNSMDRQVALKVLPAGIAADNKAFLRFMREAKTAGQLNHQNIVSVYAMGVDDNTPYYAMELVGGETLAQILLRLKNSGGKGETPFGRELEGIVYYGRLATAFADVAEGLQHAHSKGITHRDIKPSNLILDSEGNLRILDFGLARLEGQASLTASGDFLGTVLYMSPEQAMAKRIPIDHRTDIYSLGATMYEMLALQPPFEGKHHQDTLSKIIFQDPKPPRQSNSRIPREIETIVLKCLRKDPGDRYGTAEALAQDLRRFVRGDPIEARPQQRWEQLARRAWRNRWRVMAAAGLLLLVFITGFALLRQHRLEQEQLLQKRQAEYDNRVLANVLTLQLAKISLRERETFVRKFSNNSLSADSLDALNLENAQNSIRRALDDLEASIELVRDRSEGYFYKAAGLLLLKKTDPAVEALEKALSLDPEFDRARILRNTTIALGKDPEKTETESEKPARTSGLVASSLWLEAQEAVLAERWLEAAEVYEKIYMKDRRGREPYLGSTLEALLEAGFARLEANDTPRAVTHFITARGFFQSDPLELGILIGKAWHLSGEKEEAEKWFQALFDPSSSEKSAVARTVTMTYAFLKEWERVVKWASWIEPADLSKRMIAGAYMELGRPQEALEAAKEAVRIAPQNYINHLTLGEAYESNGEVLKALDECYRKAYSLNPTNRWVLLRFGEKLYRVKGEEEGLRLLKEVKSRYPRWPLVHYILALAHIKAGTTESKKLAEGCLREAIQLEPKFDLAYRILADCLMAMRRYEEALEAYDTAEKLVSKKSFIRPGTMASIYAGKGLVYRLQGNYEEALQWLRKDIDLMKKESTGLRPLLWEWDYTQLAICLLHTGEVEEAEEAFERAADFLQKQDAGYLEAVSRYPGWVHASFAWDGHYQLKNYGEAARLLDEALELGAGKKRPYIYLRAALAHEKLGDFQKAVVRGVQALEIDPDWATTWSNHLWNLARWLRRDPSLLDDPEIVEGIREVVSRLEKSQSRNPYFLIIRAILCSHTGEIKKAVKSLEGALQSPILMRDFTVELDRLRSSLGMDLPSYASIDAALREAAFEDLVSPGAEWQFLRGTREPAPGLRWAEVGFHSDWERGKSPIGYGEPAIATDLNEMQTAYTTVYLRREFQVADPDRYHRLLLSVTADDGFIAYLNGREVNRVNVGPEEGPVPHDAVAVSIYQEPHAPFEIWLDPNLLRPGRNVLAIQGLNASTKSSDFLLSPALHGEVEPPAERLEKLLESFRGEATGEDLPARLAYFEGRVLQLTGRWFAGAEEKFETVVTQDPTGVDPWLRLAESLAAQEKLPEAEERLREVLRNEWAARERRLWEAWLEICLMKLRLAPGEVLARLPEAESAGKNGDGEPADSIGWLLERLKRKESIRINCGGDDYKSQEGIEWSRDLFFIGGRRAQLRSEEIEKTEDDPVYQTERYFLPNEVTPGSYRIPLPPGEYRITLHFAERSNREAGARRYDILLEGQIVLKNFEPLKFGFCAAHSEERRIAVHDGFLDIDLMPRNKNPMISGIEIEKL